MKVLPFVLALLAGCASAPTPMLDAVCALRLLQHGEKQTVLRVRCESVQEEH